MLRFETTVREAFAVLGTSPRGSSWAELSAVGDRAAVVELLLDVPEDAEPGWTADSRPLVSWPEHSPAMAIQRMLFMERLIEALPWGRMLGTDQDGALFADVFRGLHCPASLEDWQTATTDPLAVRVLETLADAVADMKASA